MRRTMTCMPYTVFSILFRYSIFHFSLFFFNDTATTEIYTLSLHDALPISFSAGSNARGNRGTGSCGRSISGSWKSRNCRSEEHTSELQSQSNLVCRLLLEKKKKKQTKIIYNEQQNMKKTHMD